MDEKIKINKFMKILQKEHFKKTFKKVIKFNNIEKPFSDYGLNKLYQTKISILIVGEDFNKLFLDFLEKQNLINQFKKNIANYSINGNIKTIYEMFNELAPNSYVVSSFTWRNTVEGHCFWSKVNFDWLKYYRYILMEVEKKII